MAFRTKTKSDVVLERVTARLEIHSTNSAAKIDGLSLVLRTCFKKETGGQTRG